MNRDVLGRAELEALKLNWNPCKAGLMGGRCAATGTCDNRPEYSARKITNIENQKIHLLGYSRSAKDIRLKYGPLC